MALGISSPGSHLDRLVSKDTGRLGVFGGSFDPIHIGHLIVAEEARAHLNLDRVLFVPAGVSPLKPEGTLFSPAERLRMVELAIEDNPLFDVSSVELRREGPSYTVDTLGTIRRELCDEVQLFFIMGADALKTLNSWYRPRDIIRMARIVAISRPGANLNLQALEEDLPGISEATDIIDTLQIGISSTDLRSRLEGGLPIKYQVPAPVEAYIHTHWPP
ncbi:MAG: nicotinate-nucleotide adenylyltransferase [Anaerolineales bacterium]